MSDKLSARELKLRELKTLKDRQEMREGLPHLYGRKWYRWQKTFFESKAKMNLLVAANQIGKSTGQICKAIEWAGNTKLWPTLWPHTTPRILFYFYPSQELGTTEVNYKWIPEFLPRGKYKEHPTYGWKAEYEKGTIKQIVFNSGMVIQFKFYTQSATVLQASTPGAIFCDEECPEHLYDELQARLFASAGYYSMAFTATLNQVTWRRALQAKNKSDELFPDAFKLNVSMYDCVVFEDGSPSHFTLERIREIERSCKSETERQRRVHGKFVTEEGRKYHAFEPERHFIRPVGIPKDWKIYAGVDCGSGTATTHPSAISFVCVRPDYRLAFVCRGWRGDGANTTASDILSKFRDLRGSLLCTQQYYDYSAHDFGTIAQRLGEPFVKANKSHERGETVLNTLFKNNMLYVFDDEELQKLGGELQSVMKDTPKNKAKDDFADSLRYCVVDIPWDWGAIEEPRDNFAKPETEIKTRALTEEELIAMELDIRRGIYKDPRAQDHEWAELEQEMEMWNDISGS